MTLAEYARKLGFADAQQQHAVHRDGRVRLGVRVKIGDEELEQNEVAGPGAALAAAQNRLFQWLRDTRRAHQITS